jgi:predicted MFS family arabinose efflux permease
VKRSWGVVAAYGLVASASQMLWLTFAPITTASAHHFHVSEDTVGWLSEVFPLVYVLLSIPAGMALDRWFRSSLLAGAAITAFGGLVRLGGVSFEWALAGQILVAIGQPLVLNAITSWPASTCRRTNAPRASPTARPESSWGCCSAWGSARASPARATCTRCWWSTSSTR